MRHIARFLQKHQYGFVCIRNSLRKLSLCDFRHDSSPCIDFAKRQLIGFNYYFATIS